MSKLLTLKEIAIELSVPESSVRKYREIFEAFIPSVGSGRNRRYRQDAVAIFQDIRHMREDMQMPWDEISNRLAEKYPIDATPSEPPRFKPDSTPPPIVTAEEAQTTLFGASEPTHIVIKPPTAQTQPGPRWDGAAELIKRTTAIAEKNTMMVNALAIEMLNAVDEIRIGSASQANKLHADYKQLALAMIKTLGDANAEQKIILLSINSRMKELCDQLTKAEKEQQPIVIDNSDKIKDLEKKLSVVITKVEQRDKLINEYRTALENLKRENADLKTSLKQRVMPVIEEKPTDWKKPQLTPNQEKPRKSSMMKKIFGSK